MINPSLSKIFKIIVAVWVTMSVLFTTRSLVKQKDKSTFKDYVTLARSDWDGKMAFVFGKDLYEFARFCKLNLPEGSGYEIAGIPEDSIDMPRLIYYLYPHMETDDPDFILVYKKPDFFKKGTHPYASLNKESFILRRK
ncbi:hypothetical protein ACFL60_02620 [Candidatus Omnitrophota bacterium]